MDNEVKDLTVPELLHLKDDLEIQLLKNLHDIVSKFEENTGIAIKDIDINFIDAPTLNQKHDYFLTDVSIHLDM